MTHISIHGPEDLNTIIDRLLAMPMTRRHGKGLIAHLPRTDGDKPTALYMRVSSSRQAAKGKGSLPEQFHSTWEAIEKRGGNVVAIYADVCTAANRNRWAFNQLLDDIKASKFVMLGCWHSSRLVRTQLAAGEIEDAIEQFGKPIDMFAVTDTLNTDILGILAWAGRWERKAFKDRSMMGRQAALANGQPPNSSPPFWLQATRDANGTYVYSLKPVAEAIKWAAEAYANGTRNTDICRRFNAEGVPRATGKTKYGWTHQYLVQVLKYSALKGKWGPFWGQYIDVPALVDEATWDAIQARVAENGKHSGRPAKHFVALRGLLWCAECGQKMHAHARDWDYVYHRQKDGTKKRYRSQKGKLKVKYLCSGQQHYGHKCRKPEYVLDKVLFPRVWAKLAEALSHRALLMAGLESRISALENADELDELKRIEARLEKMHHHELSYAEQRAEGSISKAVHAELTLRLKEARQELLQEHEKLSDRARFLREAREQFDSVQTLVSVLPEILTEVTREEQEQLIMALIDRIEVSGDNQVAITIRLDPQVLQSLPTDLSASSPLPESPQKADSQQALLGSSSELALGHHGQKVTVARRTRSTGCRQR